MPVSQKHIKVLLLPVLILSFFTSCQESVFRSPQKTDELFVYEGLPHPMRENSYFEKEKNRKDVMKIDGHWFYQPKVKASGESHGDLMNLLLDESGFHMPGSSEPAKGLRTISSRLCDYVELRRSKKTFDDLLHLLGSETDQRRKEHDLLCICELAEGFI